MSGPVVAARPSQALRQRRESQRPNAAKASTRLNTMDTAAPKEEVKRYKTTQQDVLAKFKGMPPSLRVSLHQNHFRLNDSQEMLNYAGPMREILQHIREKTVPHNMLEEFHDLGIPFYDNCLIVEVHDHRAAGIKPKDDANSAADANGSAPFSIHNYHEYITPSPHVTYPTLKTDKKSNEAEPAAKQGKDAEKENMPAPGQLVLQKQPAKTKVTTVVLFPTPQSHLADIQLLATTPMPDAATMRRNQAAGRAAGNPPTPMTTVPPTPTLASGRSPKRQKMMVDETNLHEFEAQVYLAECPKLYLEPTKSLAESVAFIQAMTHPNNQHPAPERKTRKRTTAELAADEAEAADMQRFMLAGDEGQAGKTAAVAGGDDGQHAVRAGANQQTFSRFKTLATIKINHEDAERRKKEEEARSAQQKRQAQLEAEQQKRREMEATRQAEQSAAMMAQKQEMMFRQQQINQQQALQQASQASQSQQMANAAAHPIQAPHSATQAQFSSPVVRQQTPMASAASPLVAAHASHPIGGTPMVATASNPGAGSPPARPPSAISQHPMARSASQQQNPNMSRTGTPRLVQGTPVMNSAIPRNVSSTPTPRMNQGSPPAGMQGSTPIMMQTPQQGNQEQMQMAAQRMRMQQMTQHNMSPGNAPNYQQMALHKANMQIQANGVPNNQEANAYRQMLAQGFLNQFRQQHAQKQAQMQNSQGQMTMQNGGNMPLANMSLQQLRQQYTQRKQTLVTQFGNNVPQQHVANIRQLEMIISAREQAQAQAQAQQMSQGQMGMQPGTPQAAQMQQYQHMMAQQRMNQQAQVQAQAQAQQRQYLMRQQQLAAQQANGGGGQMNGGMNGMQNMNGMQMNGMNMNMNMNMNGMQGGMNNMGGMQAGMNMGQNVGVNQHQAQQMQAMAMMRQRQQQMHQQMGGQMGQNGNGGFDFSGA